MKFSLKWLLYFFCIFYVLLAFIIMHLGWPEWQKYLPVFIGLSSFASFLLWLDKEHPKKLFTVLVIFLIILSIFLFVKSEFSCCLWNEDPTAPYEELGFSSLIVFLLWFYIRPLTHRSGPLGAKAKERELEVRSCPFIRLLLHACWIFLAWFGYCLLLGLLRFIQRTHFSVVDLVSSWIFVAPLILRFIFKIRKTENDSENTLSFSFLFFCALWAVVSIVAAYIIVGVLIFSKR